MNQVIKIAQADIPTLNGNMYPKDELERAIKKCDQIFATFGPSQDPRPGIQLEHIAAKISQLTLTECGTLTAEMGILKTPMGQVLNGIKQKAYYNPVFTGTVSIENGIKVIRDISLLSISIDSTSAIVFAEENQ